MISAALFASALLCQPVAHVPDASVAFQPDKAAPVDLNPGVGVPAAALTVPVEVDVLRAERDLWELPLLGELALAEIPLGTATPLCPTPAQGQTPKQESGQSLPARKKRG